MVPDLIPPVMPTTVITTTLMIVIQAYHAGSGPRYDGSDSSRQSHGV